MPLGMTSDSPDDGCRCFLLSMFFFARNNTLNKKGFCMILPNPNSDGLRLWRFLIDYIIYVYTSMYLFKLVQLIYEYIEG